MCGLTCAFLSLLFVALVHSHVPYKYVDLHITDISTLHWMTDLQRDIKDKRLGELIVPGTYASTSYYLNQKSDIVLDSNVILQIGSYIGEQKQLIEMYTLHKGNLQEQLEAGYRYLDLRIVYIDNRFYWHNTFIGDPIECGLNQIYSFASLHPHEIIILSLSQFYMVNSRNTFENQMSNETLERLGMLLIRSLHGRLVDPSIGQNPIVNDVLSTGCNIIALIRDQTYLSDRFPRYFRNDVGNGYTYELTFKSFSIMDLFTEASQQLEIYHMHHRNDITISRLHIHQPSWHLVYACLLDLWMIIIILEVFILISIIYRHCHKPKNQSIVPRKRNIHLKGRIICVNYEVNCSLIFILCVNLAMYYMVYHKRCIYPLLKSSNRYQTTVKTNFSHPVYEYGVNNMLEMWTKRSSAYKLNIVLVEDFQSSTLVQTAIQFASNTIKKEISIVFVGSPLVGHTGIRKWFSCPPVMTSYMIISRDEGKVITWSGLRENEAITLQDGQYTMDAMVFITVGSVSGKWYQIYSGNIQQWIDHGYDLYIRGTESRTGRGLAYISHHHNDISPNCLSYPTSMILNSTHWDESTPATFQRRPPGLIHPNIYEKVGGL